MDTTTDTTKTYEIRISTPRRKDFDAAVGIIKNAGGTFNPATKTWTLETDDAVAAITAERAGSCYLDCMTITEA